MQRAEERKGERVQTIVRDGGKSTRPSVPNLAKSRRISVSSVLNGMFFTRMIEVDRSGCLGIPGANTRVLIPFSLNQFLVSFIILVSASASFTAIEVTPSAECASKNSLFLTADHQHTQLMIRSPHDNDKCIERQTVYLLLSFAAVASATVSLRIKNEFQLSVT